MPSVETIVAVSTPPGQGGVGIVRLSGPMAISIGQRIFKSKPQLGKRVRRVEFGRILSADATVIDEGLAWVFKGPHSYTGEDTVEISSHGSMLLLDKIVAAAIHHGAVHAGPGEFTRRAFLHGKLDLIQAEAVVDLIQAGSSRGLQNAYGLASGRLSSLIQRLRSLLVIPLALIEAGLDFSEEDIPAQSRHEIGDQIQQALALSSSLLQTFVSAKHRLEGFLVVIVGPPNAGKSTLLNALLEEDRAIVTPIPGTTRDWIEGRCRWEGCQIRLVDTAGLRHSTDIIEAEGILRTQKLAGDADVILWVLDGAQDQSLPLVPTMIDLNKTILVINKSDIGHVQAVDCIENERFRAMTSISALRGLGIDSLRKKIIEALPQPSLFEGVALSRERHWELLCKINTHLNICSGLWAERELDECLAAELRLSLSYIGNLLGEDVGEDVLDLIFSTFCIGK